MAGLDFFITAFGLVLATVDLFILLYVLAVLRRHDEQINRFEANLEAIIRHHYYKG